MTAPRYGSQYVGIAVLRAMYLHLPAMYLAGGAFFGGETEPPTLMLPTPPTAFTGPFAAIPTDGGYIYSLPPAEVGSDESPLIGLGDLRSYDTDVATDRLYRLMRIEVPIVARVGVDVGTVGVRAARGVAKAYALDLCHAGMLAALENAPQVARALDATDALNVFGALDVVTPPTIDESAALSRPLGSGSVTIDAACTIALQQWQYRPVGTPGV